MKICIITSVYALSENDRNGSFLVEANRHLAKRGHDITVFAPSYKGLHHHTIEGIPVYRFRYFLKRWENLTHGRGAPNRIRNPLYLFIALFYIIFGLIQAILLTKSKKFDLLHVHWPFPHGIWGYIAGRLSKTPMVLNFHGAELLLSKKFFFVNYFLRHAIKNSHGIICNSSYTAHKVRNLCQSPIHIIPYGVTVNATPSTKNTNKPIKDILFVGRLIRRKGLNYLIEALPLIIAHVSVNLHVVGDGEMLPAWKKLCTKLGLDNQVKFHGIINNESLEALYACADLFVLPAIIDDRGDTEGLGIVLVEALSFKTPVIASDVGGIPDVIIHEKTGLLVPEKSSQALSQAAIRLLTDTDFASTLSDTGLKHINDYFSWDRIIECVETVYQEACATKTIPI